MIRLEKGSATIFSAPFGKRQKLVIRKERQFPIETSEYSIFETELGEKASFLEIDGTTIPESWQKAAEAFQNLNGGKALVLGSTDTGKSTFCTFLVNQTLKFRKRIAIIDADIGQSDLGPPGSVGLSIVSNPFTGLDNLRVESMVFIGETSPSSVTEKVINAIEKIQTRIPPDTLCVINTDGWVSDGEAFAFKIMMEKTLKPDLIVGLAESEELDAILGSVTAPVIKIQVPKYIKARGREERRHLREYGYRRYLRNAIHKNFLLEKIKAENLFAAAIIGGEILGFLDSVGFLVGIGILENLYRRKKILRAYTNVNPRDIAEIDCGNIKLSHYGEELS